MAPPAIPATAVADFAGGGICAAIGILAAVLARDRTGKGQYVDVSMTDSTVVMMKPFIESYLFEGVIAQRGKAVSTGLWPWYNIYETKDAKYISLTAIEPWFFANLCQLLGCEDFIEHQFAEGEKREEIFRHFRQTFLTKTRDEWVEVLRQKDTCVAPVYSPDEVASDPHLISRGMIREVDHPTMGWAKQIGPMVKLSESPFQVRNWSQRFGQHTEEILLELGYSKAAIDKLREDEVIG